MKEIDLEKEPIIKLILYLEKKENIVFDRECFRDIVNELFISKEQHEIAIGVYSGKVLDKEFENQKLQQEKNSLASECEKKVKELKDYKMKMKEINESLERMREPIRDSKVLIKKIREIL